MKLKRTSLIFILLIFALGSQMIDYINRCLILF